MNPALKSAVTAPNEREVREQIERITSSTAFRTSDRLKHFITFVSSQVVSASPLFERRVTVSYGPMVA